MSPENAPPDGQPDAPLTPAQELARQTRTKGKHTVFPDEGQGIVHVQLYPSEESLPTLTTESVAILIRMFNVPKPDTYRLRHESFTIQYPSGKIIPIQLTGRQIKRLNEYLRKNTPTGPDPGYLPRSWILAYLKSGPEPSEWATTRLSELPRDPTPTQIAKTAPEAPEFNPRGTQNGVTLQQMIDATQHMINEHVRHRDRHKAPKPPKWAKARNKAPRPAGQRPWEPDWNPKG